MLEYHWGGRGRSVAEEHALELEAAQKQREALEAQVSEEGLAAMLADSSKVAAGKQVFANRCAVCHASTGGGTVGPNLTDAYWLHGKGSLMDIRRVVSEGVPDKGMQAWQSVLRPSELNGVVVYVGTLRGTNVPGGKKPQGNPVGNVATELAPDGSSGGGNDDADAAGNPGG
jgi:cytochrome c oxidase cbb3-type subunit 3